MNSNFRFRTLTIIVFCLYVFWGLFGLDLTLNPGVERIPLHRVFILLTAFIFLFNTQQVLIACLKNKILITLIIYVLLTATWANNPSDVIKNFAFLSSATFITIMTVLAFADNRVNLIRWLFWLFLFMTLASIITALHFPQIGINTVDFAKPRWMGITTHPNTLGKQALVSIWLSLNLIFLSKSRIEKPIILFAIIAASYTIIGSNSITSFITALAITIHVGFHYSFWKLKLPLKLIIFTILLASFLFIVTFYMSTSELTTTAMESTGRDATFTGRVLLWEKAIASASDSLIIGYGFDGLGDLTKKHHVQMSHLHNGYIETLVKGGVIACTLIAFIFINTLFDQLRIRSIYSHDFIFLNTGLVMILLHNFAESTILRGLNTLSIFMLFICVSTSLIANNNQNNPRQVVKNYENLDMHTSPQPY